MTAPTLSSLIREGVDAGLARVRTMRPGRVLSYDKGRNTCSVEALIPDLVEDGDGQPVSVPVAVLEDVPVATLRGRGFSLLFPLAPGDTVDLVFYDRSVERLLLTGEGGEPGDSRRHDLQDVKALPTFFTFDDVPPHASDEYASLGAEGGTNPVRVYFKDTQLCLGEESPGFSVALAEKVNARLDALEAAFNAHVHPSAPTGPTTPPLTVPGVIPVGTGTGSPTVGSVSSSTVKVRG